MIDKGQYKSALNISSGVEQPNYISEEAIKKIKNIKKKISVNDYITGILNENISILSQAITLIESSLPQHQVIAQQIIEKCQEYSGNSVRIGITGVPGVGKSTFIEALGLYILQKGKKLAILAIDPSSEKSKGSILGDKVRMEKLSTEANVYIRPTPSSGSLGGVANKTRDTIILCEAAGFDTIFIETVGVGQSEVAVNSMVDFFLLLMLSGAGDELQGIKRGIMEMADSIVINKADGFNINKAELAKVQYQNALHFFLPPDSGFFPKVLTCSAIDGSGIDIVWDNILDYLTFTKKNNYFFEKRKKQAKYWMYETINQRLKDNFFNNKALKKQIESLEKKVTEGKISSYNAAKILLNEYFKV